MPDVIRADPVTLRRLYDEHRTAQAAFRRAFLSAYGVNEPVSWMRQGEQRGVVQAHGGSDRLRVQNNETSARYWIRMRDVMEVEPTQ